MTDGPTQRSRRSRTSNLTTTTNHCIRRSRHCGRQSETLTRYSPLPPEYAGDMPELKNPVDWTVGGVETEHSRSPG
jgi:hypothetical protein